MACQAARTISAMALSAAAGCATMPPQRVTPADEVTLPKAMEAIACALKTYQNELSRLRLNTGGILDEAKVTLVLKASATGSNELVVDAKPTFQGFSAFGVSSTNRLENTGSRDNTIVLTFKHLYTASLNDPGKAEATRSGMPMGAPPTLLAPLARPCEGTLAPTPNEALRGTIRQPSPRSR